MHNLAACPCKIEGEGDPQVEIYFFSNFYCHRDDHNYNLHGYDHIRHDLRWGHDHHSGHYHGGHHHGAHHHGAHHHGGHHHGSHHHGARENHGSPHHGVHENHGAHENHSNHHSHSPQPGT